MLVIMKRNDLPPVQLTDETVLDRFNFKDKWVKISYFMGMLNKEEMELLLKINNEKTIQEIGMSEVNIGTATRMLKKGIIVISN